MEFILPLNPCRCPRPRVTRFGTYYPEKYKKWKAAAERLIRQYVDKPLEGALSVSVEFHSVIPKSYTKKQREDALCGLRWIRDDIDNLQKATFDAMTQAGVWMDDSQVVEVHATKRYALADAIVVRVEKLKQPVGC